MVLMRPTPRDSPRRGSSASSSGSMKGANSTCPSNQSDRGPLRMGTHDAAHGEHLGQIAQAQFVAQTPEHHEGDDIRRVLGPVQQRVGALVKLLATGPAAEPAIALGGALGSLRHGLRATFQASHPPPPLREKRPYTRPSPRRPRALARALTEPENRARLVRRGSRIRIKPET